MGKRAGNELSYYKARKGWCKVIRGKKYYFALGTATGPEDMRSYRQALGEYLSVCRELDEQDEQEIRALEQQGRLPNGSTIDGAMAYLDWGALSDPSKDEDSTPQLYHTIQGLVACYLEHRKLQANAQAMGKGSYANDRFSLGTFLSFCNYHGKADIEEVLTKQFLRDYRDHLDRAIAKGKLSPDSVRQRVRIVKAMLVWAYDEELLDKLPRGLTSFAKVKLPKPKPRFYTVEEVRTLYNAASQRVKLYILCGCNFAWTQIDIATLTHDMIEWEQGTITRDRHKSDVPGCWKMWPITRELLQAEMTDPKESELVLLGNQGNPLFTEKIKADGEVSKCDAIRLAFNRLRKRAKIDGGRTFKHFRKTSADLIAKQYQDKPFLVDLFLAHVPPGTNGHYVNQHFDLLHEATDWLGRTLQLGENPQEQTPSK